MSPIDYRMPIIRRSAVARIIAKAAILTMILPLGGCRICAECEDLAYPAYGGSWQRTNRESGRVGSIFDPGGAKMSNLVNRDEPDQPDAIIRELQSAKDAERDADENSDDSEASEKTDRPRLKDFRDQRLDDIENDDDLREKSLDDIEVRIIPGRAPKVVQSL